MSNQLAAILQVEAFRKARTHYLRAVAELNGAQAPEPTLAAIVTCVKYDIQYDLAAHAQASAYLHMLASVEGASSDYFRALSQDLRREAVSGRPWPKLAAVQTSIDDDDNTEWIIGMIEGAEGVGPSATS